METEKEFLEKIINEVEKIAERKEDRLGAIAFNVWIIGEVEERLKKLKVI